MADAKPKTKKLPGLSVRAKTAGFRRAGRVWSTTPQEVATSEFSKAQIDQLKNDPELLVGDIEIEVPDETPAK